jgi:hypothetical protein
MKKAIVQANLAAVWVDFPIRHDPLPRLGRSWSEGLDKGVLRRRDVRGHRVHLFMRR